MNCFRDRTDFATATQSRHPAFDRYAAVAVRIADSRATIWPFAIAANQLC